MAKRGIDCANTTLIRRVNRLYHELTQTSFDYHHRGRHRVERPFWNAVARTVLGDRDRRTGQMSQACPAERDGLVVVDLACGTGFVTETLAAWIRLPDRLIAIDLSEAALRTTARKWAALAGRYPHAPRLSLLASDGQTLPLSARSVDLLAVNAGLHHLADPPAALREIDRVLKPGGCFALGFEPNRTHFASPVMAGLSRGLARANWYASPRRNWRRLRGWVGRAAPSGARGSDEEDVLMTAINDRLMRDGFITEPLPADTLLDLVDPHARGADEAAGLDPAALLREVMPDYQAHRLITSDYLGETGRGSPVLRRVVDTTLGTLLPQHGSLFCWLVRKPVHGPEERR